jgi:hypothetical protein
VCGRDNDFVAKQNTRSGGRRIDPGVVCCKGSDQCRAFESRDAKSNRAILATFLAKLQNRQSEDGKWLPTVSQVGAFGRAAKLPAVGKRAPDNDGFDNFTYRCGGSEQGGNDQAPADHQDYAPTYKALKAYLVSEHPRPPNHPACLSRAVPTVGDI